MHPTLRTTLSFTAFLTFTTLSAQDKTKDGYSLSWNNEITVVPDSLTNDKFRLPAFKITVFESDGGDALTLFKNEMKSKSKSVGGSNPTKATVAMIPTVNANPLLLMANGQTDKKAELGQLTVVYALNDSTIVPDMTLAEQHARTLAVALNKANVQEQIDSYSKTLDKAEGKLEGAQEDIAKNEKALAKANKALSKAKNAVLKLTATNTQLKSQVTGLESKFGITNDPNDLKALTKAREKLASSEGTLAKQMKAETKAAEDVSKYQGKSPEQAKEEAQRAEATKANAAIVDALKKKMMAIK